MTSAFSATRQVGAVRVFVQLVRQLVRKGADVQHVFGRYGVRLSTARGVHARCNARNWADAGYPIAGAKALQPVFLARCSTHRTGRSERRSVMLTTFTYHRRLHRRPGCS